MAPAGVDCLRAWQYLLWWHHRLWQSWKHWSSSQTSFGSSCHWSEGCRRWTERWICWWTCWQSKFEIWKIKLGCTSVCRFNMSVQWWKRTAHPARCEPISVRDSVQTATVLAFSCEMNNLDSIQQWSEQLWRCAAQRGHNQAQGAKAKASQNSCSDSARRSTSGPITCRKACFTYKTRSAVVTDMTIALTLGVWYVEAC